MSSGLWRLTFYTSTKSIPLCFYTRHRNRKLSKHIAEHTSHSEVISELIRFFLYFFCCRGFFFFFFVSLLLFCLFTSLHTSRAALRPLPKKCFQPHHTYKRYFVKLSVCWQQIFLIPLASIRVKARFSATSPLNLCR